MRLKTFIKVKGDTMKYKRYRKNSIYLLIIAIFLTVGANAFAEEENIDGPIEEETIEIDDRMEIYPNIVGTEFEQVQIEKEPQTFGENMGGPTVEILSAPAGGPYVGHLSGKGSGTTVNVFSTYNSGTAITYITNNSSSGVFPILDEAGSRYKIAISGAIGWIDKSVVNLVKFNPDTIAHDFYQKQGNELIHYITSNATSLWYSKVTQGEAPNYLGSGQYMSWDGHYFYPASYNGFANLINDYNSGHRNNSINKNEPFYNYFQWLPARTQTTLEAKDFEAYLRTNGYTTIQASRMVETGKLFLDNGNYYGGNSALAFATGVHESGWGTPAGFAPNRNNFFGHNAYDSAPGMASRYPTPNYGIGIHFGSFWNWNYLNPVSYTNNGGAVGDKGAGMNVKYASDAYWGEKIAAHYYNMDKNAGGKDYKRYTLATIDAAGVNLRKTPSTSAGVVYKTKNTKNTIAIIEETSGTNVGGSTTWYGYTSEPHLDGNKNVLAYDPKGNQGDLGFNISKSTVYIHSSFVTKVSTGKNSKILNQLTNKPEATPTISSSSTTIYTLGEVNLRVDPSTKRSVILTIPANTKLTGNLTNNGWVQVLYHQGGEIYQLGYVSQDHVSKSKGGKPISGGGTVNPDPDPKPDPLPQPGNVSRYVVPDVGLHLREKPNGTSNSLGLIAKDTEVKTGTPLNGWVHATVGGKSGYMSVDFLTTTKPSKPDPKPDPDPLPQPGNTTMYTTDAVNMRKTPGNGSVIVLVPKGVAVKTGTAVNGWVHATYNGNSGYMSADYLTKTKPTTPTYKTGDVNGDGKVTSLDYMIIKNYIMGKRTLTASEKERADVNKDGRINSQDYMRVKNIIMGR